MREAAERERQEAVRLLQEALRKAAASEREANNGVAIEDEVVNGSPRPGQENSDKDKVEHRTENGCEVAPNECLVKLFSACTTPFGTMCSAS